MFTWVGVRHSWMGICHTLLWRWCHNTILRHLHRLLSKCLPLESSVHQDPLLYIHTMPRGWWYEQLAGDEGHRFFNHTLHLSKASSYAGAAAVLPPPPPPPPLPISSTWLLGKTPTCPFNSPSHHPLSSLYVTVIISPVQGKIDKCYFFSLFFCAD